MVNFRAFTLIPWVMIGTAATSLRPEEPNTVKISESIRNLTGGSMRVWVLESIIGMPEGTFGYIEGQSFHFAMQKSELIVLDPQSKETLQPSKYKWKVTRLSDLDTVLAIEGRGTYTLSFRVEDGKFRMRLRDSSGDRTAPIKDLEFITHDKSFTNPEIIKGK